MTKFYLVLFILLIFALPTYAEAPLLISEIQISGGTGLTKQDYIKIYNTTDNILDLAGYNLVKRTQNGASDNLIYNWTNPTPLTPRGFYLWANADDGFANSLPADVSSSATISTNNSIALRQGALDTGLIIDAISWGSTSSNSLGLDKHWSNPSSNKITIDVVNTPPQNNTNNQNTNTSPLINMSSGGGSSNYCSATPGQVVINEIFSNPQAGETEWVELYNNCNRPVNLNNWILTDGSGTPTKLSGILDNFFVIEAPKGKLNNAGDEVVLSNDTNDIIDHILYGSWDDETGPTAPNTDQSLSRWPDGSGDFVITNTSTKNQANIIDSNQTVATTTPTLTQLIINEILPNPPGADDLSTDKGYEYIELFNPSDKTIQLKNWRLAVGNQKPYLLPEQELLAGDYLLLKRQQTNLVLNNQTDTVKLYQPDSLKALQTVTYRDSLEGLSYAYATSTQTWFWTTTPTPGIRNLINEPNQAPKIILETPDTFTQNQIAFFDASDSFDPEGGSLNFFWEFNDGATSTARSLEKLLTTNDTGLKLTISDGELSNSQFIKLINSPKTNQTNNNQAQVLGEKTAPVINLTPGQIKLTGIVVTEPGLFGTQYFYLAPFDGNNLISDKVIQVYNNKKDFPQLKQGDYLEATGELYDISTDTRLKIDSAKAITILDHDYSVVEKRLEISQLKAELNNQLIGVSGQITEKKSDGFFLDDGTGEIFIALKTATGLAPKHFTLNNSYQITGLLKQEASGLKLYPRSAKDIIETSADITATTTAATTDSPATPVNIKTVTQTQDKLWQYLSIASWGVTLSLLVLLIKNQYSKPKE